MSCKRLANGLGFVVSMLPLKLASPLSRKVVALYLTATGDIFMRNWAGGKDTALNMKVIHPLQGATRRGAATTPAGQAMLSPYPTTKR